MVIAVFLILAVILIAFGTPVAFSLGISSLYYILLDNTASLAIITRRMIGGIDSFVLIAIPFFVLAARLMSSTSISQRIFNFARCFVGFLPGGMAHVNILASIIFAGMSGAAVADVAGLGIIEMDAMKKDGYEIAFSAAVTAASSTIGPIIPPSIPMVIYAWLAEASVGALFLGGFLPGLMMGIAIMIYTYFIAKKRNYPRSPVPSWKITLFYLKEGFFAILAPVILLGGIFSGVTTPTEAGAIAVLYAIILTICYREMSFKILYEELLNTLKDTGVIMIITSSAALFGWVIARLQIPQMFSKVFLSATDNPLFFLMLVNVLLLILGALMETNSIMIIIIPILMPVALSLGIDKVHFGIVLILNLMIGLLTPPFGVCSFIICNAAGITMKQLMKELWPYTVVLIVVLFLITYFPQFYMWLPRMFFTTT